MKVFEYNHNSCSMLVAQIPADGRLVKSVFYCKHDLIDLSDAFASRVQATDQTLKQSSVCSSQSIINIFLAKM